jgi:hypothetical protein
MRAWLGLLLLGASPLNAQQGATVDWQAGGGSISSTGRYQAQTIGTFMVRASLGTLRDSATVRATPSTGGEQTPGGKRFGPMNAMALSPVTPFTASGGEAANQPAWLLATLQEAKQAGLAVIANLPGGSHSADKPGYCLTQRADGVWRFDRAKFDARLALYDSEALRTTLAAAVRDGTLLMVNLMDEPWVYGADDGAGSVVGNTWGPKGTMTRARVDSLCLAARRVLGPTVPVGSSENTTLWDPTRSTTVCDIGIEQYSYRFGDVVAWRDASLTRARRDGTARIFSFNILNGGTQDRDGVWDCATQGKVRGTRSPNCSMTADQITAVSKALGDAGCGALIFWRSDARFTLPAWQQAFQTLATLQAGRAPRPCSLRPR